MGNAITVTAVEGRLRLRKAEISTKPWSGVDKSKLPKECFLWVEDPEKKETWHLPVYEGAGPMEDGMYTKRGLLNANAVRAARAAVGGARTGTPMAGMPASVKSRLEGMMRMVEGMMGDKG